MAYGSCAISSDGCVTSPGYPSNYASGQKCVFTMPELPLRVEAFSTEGSYDKLKVNGQDYSGERGTDDVTPSGGIEWTSDGSTERSGWKICAPPGTSCEQCPPGTISAEAAAACASCPAGRVANDVGPAVGPLWQYWVVILVL